VLKLGGKLQCGPQYDDGDDDRSKMHRVAVVMTLQLSITIELHIVTCAIVACSTDKFNAELSTDS
jgi:hypothetical protein